VEDLVPVLITYGSWLVLGWVFLDLTMVPIPSEIVLLAAGSLAASGRIEFSFAILAGVVGALLADHVWFYVGRRRGQPALHLLCRLTSRSSQCHDKTLALFSRFGVLSLVVAKFFPGLRTVVPSMAGASGLPYPVFLGAGGMGTLIWVVAISSLGYVFAGQVREMVGTLRHLHAAALSVMLGLAVGLPLFAHMYARRPSGDGNPAQCDRPAL